MNRISFQPEGLRLKRRIAWKSSVPPRVIARSGVSSARVIADGEPGGPSPSYSLHSLPAARSAPTLSPASRRSHRPRNDWGGGRRGGDRGDDDQDVPSPRSVFRVFRSRRPPLQPIDTAATDFRDAVSLVAGYFNLGTSPSSEVEQEWGRIPVGCAGLVDIKSPSRGRKPRSQPRRRGSRLSPLPGNIVRIAIAGTRLIQSTRFRAVCSWKGRDCPQTDHPPPRLFALR